MALLKRISEVDERFPIISLIYSYPHDYPVYREEVNTL